MWPRNAFGSTWCVAQFGDTTVLFNKSGLLRRRPQGQGMTTMAEVWRARCRGEHLRELPHRKTMLTLLTATKDIDISEAAVLAKLLLS